MRPIIFATSFFVSACAMSNAWSQSVSTDPLKAAIQSSHRSEANKARDAARHPYETLTFFGIKPTMTVVELAPGGGWYTEILAPYLRENGRLIAATFDPESKSDYSQRNLRFIKDKLAQLPTVYDKVELGIFEPGLRIQYAAPNSVDLIVTFRNVHNWISAGPAALKSVFDSAFVSLKPGGVLGVVEHRLPSSKTQDAKASSGYVHEAYVIQQAQAAGFVLSEKSEINANPNDTADHPKGVWTLPPTYANKEVDREKYKQIGESDRMTLKFIKPKN